MAKRPATDDLSEEEHAPKRPKLNDTRHAITQVFMNKNLVASTLSPFLRTSEVNSLLQTCKMQREHLDTNPNAWSPALQIGHFNDIPYIRAKNDDVTRFFAKISPNLRSVEIVFTVGDLSSSTGDATGAYIAIVVKQPLSVLSLVSHLPGGTRVDVTNWHLHANTIVFSGTSFGHLTADDESDDEPNFLMSKHVTEIACTLDEYHRHKSLIALNDGITTLRIDASAGGEYKCKYCSASYPRDSCMARSDSVQRLYIKLGDRWSYESQDYHFLIEDVVERMPNLHTLVLWGETNRPKEWIEASIVIMQQRCPNLVVDCYELRVPKMDFVPFVVRQV